MAKEISLKLYDEIVRGPNDERRIAARDWRDPDVYLVLDGTKVYSRDAQYNQHQGAVEPDWDKGWYVMEQATNKIVMEFKGPCPSPFRESLLEGRELVGVVVARDFQRHS